MAERVRYVNTASSGGDGTTNGESGATAAYASLSAWEAAEQTDLVSAGDTHVVNCGVGSGSAVDATETTVAGWTTGASNGITIQANPSDTGGDQRAQMPWSSSIYRLYAANVSNAAHVMLTITQNYVTVSKLQIGMSCNASGSSRQMFGVEVSDNDYVVLDSLHVNMWGNYTSSHGIYNVGVYNNSLGTGSAQLLLRNCFVQCYNRYSLGSANSRTDGLTGVYVDNSSVYTTMHNNTIFVDGRGVNVGCAWLGYNTSKATCYNNVFYFNGTAGATGAFGDGNDSVEAGTNNATDDTTYTGTGADSFQNDGEASFVSADWSAVANPFNMDLNVEEGSDLLEAGADMSGSYTVDFNGDTRPATFSVGADDYSAPAPSGGTHELTQTISVSTFSVGPIIVQPVDTDS